MLITRRRFASANFFLAAFGVESYLGVLEEVKDEYVVLKSYFNKDKTFLGMQCIESFKEEPAKS
ncbi:MAG: hypothetical protein ACE5KJ_04580 [Candidatus Zixiibacteriota bacterium]